MRATADERGVGKRSIVIMLAVNFLANVVFSIVVRWNERAAIEETKKASHCLSPKTKIAHPADSFHLAVSNRSRRH
jgi:predicted transglutaminase-like protease